MLPEISDVQIVPIRPQNGLIGFVSFVIEKKWYVSNIALYTRLNGGYRLVYPSKKIGLSNQTLFNPIHKGVGDYVEQIVSEKAETVFEKVS